MSLLKKFLILCYFQTHIEKSNPKYVFFYRERMKESMVSMDDPNDPHPQLDGHPTSLKYWEMYKKPLKSTNTWRMKSSMILINQSNENSMKRKLTEDFSQLLSNCLNFPFESFNFPFESSWQKTWWKILSFDNHFMYDLFVVSLTAAKSNHSSIKKSIIRQFFNIDKCLSFEIIYYRCYLFYNEIKWI